MKNFFGCLWIIFGSLWILATNEEERRQYEYDLGYGEIEK